MPVLDFASKAIHFHFAIGGAPVSGKDELLAQIHASLPPVRRDEIFVRALGADQMAGFDFSPACLVPISDFVAQVRIATLLGAIAEFSNWSQVLAGIDALLFVLDDSRARLPQNVAALIALGSIPELDAVPIVFFFRKSGSSESLSFEALNAEFNPAGTFVVMTPETAAPALLAAALAASGL